MNEIWELLARWISYVFGGGLVGAALGAAMFFGTRRAGLFERPVRAWALATWLALPWLTVATGLFGTSVGTLLAVRAEVRWQLESNVLPPARTHLVQVRAFLADDLLPLARRTDSTIEVVRKRAIGALDASLVAVGAGAIADEETLGWIFEESLALAIKVAAGASGIDVGDPAQTWRALRDLDPTIVTEALLQRAIDAVVARVSRELMAVAVLAFVLWLALLTLVATEIALARSWMRRFAPVPAPSAPA